MPLTLKLSREFYDRLGHQVADEFVHALNAVDSSYRQEFRDLFDTHFSRLEERLDAMKTGLAGKVDRDVFEARLAGLESRLDGKLADLKSELLSWMLLCWVGTMGTVLAIVKL